MLGRRSKISLPGRLRIPAGISPSDDGFCRWGRDGFTKSILLALGGSQGFDFPPMTPSNSTPAAGQLVGLFPELLGVGGVQEASRQVLCAVQNVLDRHGWSAAYLGLNDPQGPQRLQRAGRSVHFRGFKRSKFRFVLQSLRLARQNPRIVIAAHPHLALPTLVMKGLSPTMKTIVVCHGVEVWARLPAPRRYGLLAADIVLAPSNYTAVMLRKVQGVAAEKIRMLPWPVNAEMLRMSDEPSNLPLPAGFPDGRVILTVGRWVAAERYKGADDLIRAMPKLLSSFGGLHLVAIGSGDDLPRLRRIVTELGVGTSVHFLERVSSEELSACYANAEVFALPSTGEGFGIVFLEAMAFGLPVVGAAAGGVTDVVQDGVNGILVPGKDLEALVRALDRLLRDRGLGSEMGKRGSDIVRDKYQLPTMENKLESILVECGLESLAVG
jgi:phosphatidyl-myo-inositol dimannoside synthase